MVIQRPRKLLAHLGLFSFAKFQFGRSRVRAARVYSTLKGRDK